MYKFKVMGRAVPQGSKVAFAVRGKNGKHRAIIKEQSGKRHKDWRALMKATIKEVVPDTPLTGPVCVYLDFYLPRPKSHYRQSGGVAVLRDDAPKWVSNRSVGDIDKLTRAVLDSLDDAGMYEDDSQVAVLGVTRLYTDGDPNVHGTVGKLFEMEGEQ